MIEVKNIVKKFGNEVILDDISFRIEKGEYLAIMGPSGSGKSTLLYSFSGMDRVDSGEVLFEGKNIVSLNEKEISSLRLNKMGFVFQNAQMLKNLSILDNILLPGFAAGRESAESIRKRAEGLMEQMEISKIAEHDVTGVSGGQLQRAAICRAMINEPEVLFLDEPTGALNSEATGQVLSILKDLNEKGITIVMVTHDPHVASQAKSTIYIRDGKIAGGTI